MRLPVDPAPRTTAGQPAIRLAWLLVVSRLAHPDPAMVNRASFARHLRARGITADVSRVSRWESGQQPVPPRLLEVYEQALDLPRWSLVVLSRILSREAGTPPVRLPAPHPDSDPTLALEHLITRVLAPHPHGEAVRGVDWLLLCDQVTSYDLVFLDQDSWSSICTRLLAELTRTSGTERRFRWDAAATLAAHPVAGRHLVAALAEWLSQPAVQQYRPAVLMLAKCRLPAADDLLGDLLSTEGPNSAGLRDAAMTAIAMKLSLDSFGSSRRPQVIDAVAARLTPPGSRPTSATLDLATQLSRAELTHILSQMSDAGLRNRVREVANTRLLIPQEAADRVAAGITARLRDARTGSFGQIPDPLLDRLVVETVFHVSVTPRWLAGVLLGLSPFVDALVEALVDLTAQDDPALAALAWRAILASSDESSSPHLVRAAIDERREGAQAMALTALSRSSVRLTDSQVDYVVDIARGATSTHTRLAALTVLARHAPGRLCQVATASPPVDGAVQWWQALGPAT